MKDSPAEKAEKLLELLDFFVLSREDIKDIYFIELLKDDSLGKPKIIIGATVKMPSDMEMKMGLMVHLHNGSKDVPLAYVFADIPFEERSQILGDSLGIEEISSVLNAFAVGRVWKLSSAICKDEAKATLAKSVFARNRKACQGTCLTALTHGIVDLVPAKAIDELAVMMDLGLHA